MKRSRTRFTLTLLYALLFALCAAPALASTGCNYPTSLDSWIDKSTNDFLTATEVNQFRCAIEKLESGPLRPNKGAASAPAYGFQGDADTGMNSLAGNQLDFTGDVITFSVSGGSTERGRIASGIWLWGTTQSAGAAAGEIVVANSKGYRFVNAAGTSSANYGVFGSASDHMSFLLPISGSAYFFQWAGVAGGIHLVSQANTGGIRLLEGSGDFGTAANAVDIYAKDNGAGKTTLCAKFFTGATQCFATEP